MSGTEPALPARVRDAAEATKQAYDLALKLRQAPTPEERSAFIEAAQGAAKEADLAAERVDFILLMERRLSRSSREIPYEREAVAAIRAARAAATAASNEVAAAARRQGGSKVALVPRGSALERLSRDLGPKESTHRVTKAFVFLLAFCWAGGFYLCWQSAHLTQVLLAGLLLSVAHCLTATVTFYSEGFVSQHLLGTKALRWNELVTVQSSSMNYGGFYTLRYLSASDEKQTVHIGSSMGEEVHARIISEAKQRGRAR